MKTGRPHHPVADIDGASRWRADVLHATLDWGRLLAGARESGPAKNVTVRMLYDTSRRDRS